ncbi:5-(carboxyamino)imidazole ribonucleotide mutase [Seleniivibrio woodruffii]|uniref:N5-carboxyaminoimidazole ribonucleotide mutase n=1 Tax=Seleniivibrio woodruffii TaxID=1078050 RepID=A0A4R1K934_9BACT|nr:5-(carboxyamino)imidazole ribonucleotide mutase [Seleniivibrio woodruffii]TCK60517.1 5-(carboxyamino)imidazole ribonucleotide mutase [Seleniivibrio woodruffii]TVZ36145.1 5-(carboxyamino)imidazole ribonucleotide mutase [Seleniivibrio woodruffii]
MSKVGIIMGSKNDFEIAREAVEILKEFGIEFEVIVSSAHRTPERTLEWAKTAEDRGLDAIIALAGAAAHLAGVVASETNLPIIAVPVSATSLNGLDALLSMVQMPGGIPVATMAIGKAGAKNAGIFAGQIIARSNKEVAKKVAKYKEDMKEKVYKDNEAVQEML